MKMQLLLGAAIPLAVGSAALADHSAPHPPPAVNPPVTQQISTPPLVVPKPTPAPTLQLPALGMPGPSTILPTDVSGFHMTDNLKPETGEFSAFFQKDERYQFTGEWISFSSNYSASRKHTDYRDVSYSKDTTKFGQIEYSEPVSAQATFMPTIGAKFERVNGAHLKLVHGAIIVRGASECVSISARLCSEDVVSQIGGNALAVVSAFDEKPTILNLTDASDNAVMLYVPTDHASSKMQSVKLKPGQIAEAYKLDSKPTSNLVAKRITISQKIGPHCGLLVSECHYARALRKFNLVASLPKEQYRRVLKTAASLEHVNR